MSFFNEINKLLNECECKKDKFIIDFENKMIIPKDLDTIKGCENNCGIMTKVTIYLISNDIDYNFLDDYSIKLNIA